jgi:hypothetical protein
MAFPYLAHVNFEDGTKQSFNTETDTGGKLDFAHYSTLAKIPGMPAPWRGAYCMRIDLAPGTQDAYLQEDDDLDLSADGALHVKWKMWVSTDVVMANNDEFLIFSLQSTGPVNEVVVALNYTTANGLRIGVGETAAAQLIPCPTGRWFDVELHVELDAGGGNDGSVIMRIDGQTLTTVATLDQAAIIQARLGVQGQDSGTTRGVLLFDHFMADDARLYPTNDDQRWSYNQTIYKSGHLFVGRGTLENIQLITGDTDNILECWDTDSALTTDVNRRKVYLVTSTAEEIVDPAGMPVTFTRGCYVTLSGTAAGSGPQAIAKFCNVAAWGSDGAVKTYGQKRKPLAQGA